MAAPSGATPRADGWFCREEETMDDQGGSRGRHAAEPGGPDDAESGAGTGSHGAQGEPQGSDDPTGPNAVADPGDAPSATDPSTASTAETARGRMRQQDPATTTPRAPTVAEQRARREAQRRERAQAEAAQAAEERKRTVRKRVLIGGGVAVGLVAVVAIVYAASQPDEVEAQCTDQRGVVVDDSNWYCSGNSVGGYYGGGFVPIFLGGGGDQYHYNYGSRAPIGSVVSGGTTTPPRAGPRCAAARAVAHRVTTSSGSSVAAGSASAAAAPRAAAAVPRAAAADAVRRERSRPRPDWAAKVAEQGLVFGTPARGADGDRPYWDESVHYVFEMDEMLGLEADVELLHSMCLEAVEHVVTHRAVSPTSRMPEWAGRPSPRPGSARDPHLYGRFDLRYDGSGPAKLLEYNADTPTSLLEAAICSGSG